jgi:hypothetical protein
MSKFARFVQKTQGILGVNRVLIGDSNKIFYSTTSSISSKLILNLPNGITNSMFYSKYYQFQ